MRDTAFVNDLSALGVPRVTSGTSLVVAIQESLRDAIISGTFAPGDRLRETPIAAHFGVSSTPVREALRQLEAEGLVTLFPRRGAIVVAMSSTEVRELYEIRLLVEPHTTRQAALRAPSAAELEKAQRIADHQAKMATKGRIPSPPVDADFHRELALLGGNSAMAALVERVTRQIETVQSRSPHVVKDGLAHAAEAHLAILESVGEGKAERAGALMEEHLRTACDLVMDTLTTTAP